MPVKKCVGCGATLQNTDKNNPGYVEDLNNKYCMECFKLKNYGVSNNNMYKLQLMNIEENSVCLLISSIMHLDMLFNYPVHRFQPFAKYVYIINQIDLLPRSTNLDMLMENVIEKAKREKIPYFDIIFMSALNNTDIENLANYILGFKEKKIYLLGVQNSGKTSIFKGLTKNQEALSLAKAGLTIEALEGNLEDKKITDMPGLFQEGYLHTILPYDIYKNIIPSKRIKPKIYQVSVNDAFIINGMIGIKYLKGPSQTLVFYINNNLDVHKTNVKKQDDLMKSDKLSTLDIKSFEKKSFKLSDQRMQITFADLGFCQTITEGLIEVTIPKGLNITLTEALFK